MSGNWIGDFPAAQLTPSQTADGYLWLGTETGLVRFDGVSFRVYSEGTSPQAPAGPVQQLVSDLSGALWIRQRDTTLRRYREGLFKTIIPDDRSAGVTAVCRSQSGALVALTQRNGLFEYDANGAGSPLPPGAMGKRLVISLAETADKKLWIGFRDAGLLEWENGQISFINRDVPDTKINALLPSRQGQLWIGTDNGLVRWDGAHVTNEAVPATLRHSQISSLLEDSASDLWVGTGAGLVRIDPGGAVFPERTHDPSHSQINAIFEDRERNIWVGTGQGLERFRSRAFENLEAEDEAGSGSGGPVYVDNEERIWSTDARNDLRWRRGATTARDGLPFGRVNCLLTDPTGIVWIGSAKGLAFFRSGRIQTVESKFAFASGEILGLAADSEGALWIASDKSIFRASSKSLLGG